MNLRKCLGLITIVAVVGVAVWNYQQSRKHVVLSDLALANIEALTDGEVIEGAVCFYKGNEIYEKRIPCMADYPNIGPCGEPEYGFYSSNRAQCAK